MLTRKQKIAKFIQDHPKASFDDWVSFQLTVPEIRLKKCGKGVVLINLEGKSGFSDPKSWLANHRAGCVQRLERAVMDCDGILTRKDVERVLMALNPVEGGQPLKGQADSSVSEELMRVLLVHNKARNALIRAYIEEKAKPGRAIIWFLYALTFNREFDSNLELDEAWRQILEETHFGH